MDYELFALASDARLVVAFDFGIANLVQPQRSLEIHDVQPFGIGGDERRALLINRTIGSRTSRSSRSFAQTG